MSSKKQETTKSLIAEYHSRWELVNVAGCYDVRDLARMAEIEQELSKRGYEISEARPVITRRLKGQK